MLSHRRVAFTLIELLVVVAVIVILMAILFPVFAQARQRAGQAACQSNLKQVGMALAQYTSDHDGRWPYSEMVNTLDNRAIEGAFSGWVSNLLDAYLKSWEVYACPSNTDAGWFVQPQTGRNVGYCYNYRWLTYESGGSLYGIDESQLSQASAGVSGVAVMWDSRNSWNDSEPWSTAGLDFRDLSWYRGEEWEFTSWHQQAGNYLFADGHAKAAKWGNLTWEQVEPLADVAGSPNRGRACPDGFVVQ